MNLGARRSQLATLAKELHGHWGETKTHWRDVRSQEFEARYLEPLETQLNAALTAIEKLEGVLKKVRSDCE
jgi:hypothetical protein